MESYLRSFSISAALATARRCAAPFLQQERLCLNESRNFCTYIFFWHPPARCVGLSSKTWGHYTLYFWRGNSNKITPCWKQKPVVAFEIYGNSLNWHWSWWNAHDNTNLNFDKVLVCFCCCIFQFSFFAAAAALLICLCADVTFDGEHQRSRARVNYDSAVHPA